MKLLKASQVGLLQIIRSWDGRRHSKYGRYHTRTKGYQGGEQTKWVHLKTSKKRSGIFDLCYILLLIELILTPIDIVVHLNLLYVDINIKLIIISIGAYGLVCL